MGEGEKERYTQLLKAQAHIWNLSLGYINSAALKCVIDLSIPDIIHNHGNKITLKELVVALPIHPSKFPYIYHIMRILVNSGIFSEEEGGYSLTPSSRLLLKDEPLNAIGIVKLVLAPPSVRIYENMSEWLQNGSPTLFDMSHGKTYWEYSMEEPRFASLFGEAMSADSDLVASVLVSEEYKGIFQGLDSIVDVGGSSGSVCKAIARAFPELKCTVFDLPHVVGNIEGSENLNFVGGDMFEAIPSANAVLLKWILHNWSDENCLKILKKCKKAIPSKEKGGKVIILDTIINIEKEVGSEKLLETQLFMGMAMMALFGSKERSENEFVTLFNEAGFSNYKKIPISGTFRSIIEVYP